MTHLHGHYNISTVSLSFLIAATASYLALTLSVKIANAKGANRLAWLLTGSFVMGIGIWSMHFVGMLAFHLARPIAYDPFLTGLSMLAAVTASYIAFWFNASVQRGGMRFTAAGLFMGGGIAAMHYIGMAAIRKPVAVTYSPILFLLSILIAVAASYAALYLFNRFRRSPGFSRWKLASATLMGVAVTGMHYTGMAASRFHLSEELSPSELAAAPDSRTFLLGAVAVCTFFLLSVVWTALYLDKNFLERLAYTDALTGLPNRNSLAQYFADIFPREKDGFVLFLDLDRFKTINDTMGHDAGDLFIAETAKRLMAAIGMPQTIFRLGGDEFLIASASGGRAEAAALADDLIAAVKQPYLMAGTELFLTASLGISLSPEHGTDRTALMKAADMAMYNAKQTGKNRYVFFDVQNDRKMIRKLILERDLRTALSGGELVIHYQPKWDAELGRLIGLEALLRWQHPRLDLVSPAEFIPIAEETGVIIPITRWMLQEVCLQNQEWRDTNAMRVCVSVNMSIRVFESGQLYDMVTEALADSGLPPAELELEITESIAMQDVEDTIRQLKQLRELGVRVSMDDFGTGYSSLGNLDEMPINALKIDQTFVRQSGIPSKQAIISTIITIAELLQLEVVAEGVETEEQIRFLQSRGCRVMQGYYYGRPMNADALMDWVKTS